MNAADIHKALAGAGAAAQTAARRLSPWPFLLLLLSAGAAFSLSPAGPPARGQSVKPDRPIERQDPGVPGTRPAETLVKARASGHEIASFGTGCFWCSEDDLRRTKGVVATEVGFQGGTTKRPTYKEVCRGGTGHVETTKVEFDPRVISYRSLVKRFFEIHDPTQGNRQGPDFGVQYRSVIFYYSPEQAKIAQEELKSAQKKLSKPITTTIEAAPAFWRAEDYHQQYYQKMGYSHSGE